MDGSLGAVASAVASSGPPPKIADNTKRDWNNFIGWMKTKGYSGSSDLDVRNKNLGQQYLQQYIKENPQTTLTYGHVPDIQNYLNAYRQAAWNKIQTGQAGSGARNIDEFMPNLSPTDGWLGSKTSQVLFPSSYQNGKFTGYADIPAVSPVQTPAPVAVQNNTPVYNPNANAALAIANANK